MRHARATPRLAAIFVAATLATGCGHTPQDAPEAPAPTLPRDAFARARAALAALSRGTVPPDLDAVVQDLSLEARQPRGVDAMRAAGDLIALRWRLRRDPRDLSRALDYYQVAGADPSKPGGCAALRQRAELLASAASPLAPSARDAYETACVPPPLRTAAQAPPVAPSAVSNTRVRRVVIDPGHGGSDPGAIGPTGLTEASVTLDVARRVADRLSGTYGVQVILTRDDDTYVDLESRAAHANDSGADLFVSVHCNSAPNREAHGVATFVLDTASERVAARVNRRDGELVSDDPVSSWQVANILTGLRLSSQGRHSIALAESIQQTMLHDLRLLYPAVDDLGVHPAAFQVLVTARMPAVLVELSFISNAMEEQRLRAEGYRDVLAAAVARAVATYGM
ncbi:MAG: N-acetylmuramoyl-L-alanine amidase [Polyangiales bacterium]